MLLGYLIHKDNLAKAIKRTVGIIKNIEHHIPFAAIKTIRGQLLLLPNRAHLAFHIAILWKICQLLKLIYAHNNSDSLFLGKHLWQLQYRHLVFLLRHKLQVKGCKICNLIV